MQQGVAGATTAPARLDPDHLFGSPADQTASGRSRRHLRAVAPVPLDFDAAVRALTPRLQRYAARRLGDRHEAEELVQEALLRAYQHRADLSTEDDVAAWTTCVTGRLVIDRLRVRARSTTVADVPEGGRMARDTADVVVARDQARLALDVLDAMPARQAAVLWAREVEGLGYDAIGQRFAMSEPAVRSLLTRARKALRKEYAVRGGTLPSAGLAVLAPWASGTGWLERLRGSVERLTTPAALGVLGAGLVSGALILPLVPGPQLSPAPAVTRSAAPDDQTVTRAAPVPAPAAGSAAAPSATPPAATPTPSAAAARGLLGSSGVDDTCVSAAGAGAGGNGCAPGRDDPLLSVDPPVDTSPAGIQLPGVASDAIDCTRLPAVPHTRCTTPSGAS